MNISDVLDELKTLGLIDRARRVKCGDIELELAPPVDTERKTMTLEVPHGTGLSEDEATKREESELIAGLYGAAQGIIPSDYGPT